MSHSFDSPLINLTILESVGVGVNPLHSKPRLTLEIDSSYSRVKFDSKEFRPVIQSSIEN